MSSKFMASAASRADLHELKQELNAARQESMSSFATLIDVKLNNVLDKVDNVYAIMKGHIDREEVEQDAIRRDVEYLKKNWWKLTGAVMAIVVIAQVAFHLIFKV